MNQLDDALSPAEAQEVVEIIRGRLEIWLRFEANRTNPNPGIPGGLPQQVADIIYKARRSSQDIATLSDEAILAAYQRVRTRLQEQAKANTYYI